MQYALWILSSIVAYIAGLYLIFKVTPRLLTRSFDEGMFIGIAALDIFAALLAFGGVVVIYALFNGSVAIRFVNFFLIVGILYVTIRMALYCFRGAAVGTFRVSRIIAGSYTLLLAAAAVFYLIQLFVG